MVDFEGKLVGNTSLMDHLGLVDHVDHMYMWSNTVDGRNPAPFDR